MLCSGGMLNVSGSSTAMLMVEPMPGSAPKMMPITAPNRHNPSAIGSVRRAPRAMNRCSNMETHGPQFSGTPIRRTKTTWVATAMNTASTAKTALLRTVSGMPS